MVLVKGAKPAVAWKGLSNRLSPVVVGVFTHEIEHAREMLRSTIHTMRTLNSALLKAWRHFTNHIERPEVFLSSLARLLACSLSAPTLFPTL